MDIRVKITRDGTNEVRTIELEEYLRGVIPSEIKASTCPLEAQKAQAIAARTYAIRKIQNKKTYRFDVDDTANYQAYNARPRHPNSNKAVAQTSGQYLTYDNKIIDAVFTNSNGGYCVSAYNKWGSDIPYLPGQKDAYDRSGKVSGHGVGMSQVGAAERAKAGMTCEEILAFYYPGTKIKTLKERDEIMEDVKLSPHFTLKEFFNPDNYKPYIKKLGYTPDVTADDIDDNLVDLLEKLRTKFREKYPSATIEITPHGGYRPDAINTMVGGAKGSQHRYGKAADFKVKIAGKYLDMPTIAVYTEKWMKELSIKGGIGAYKGGFDANYIHVDVRGKDVRWYLTYSSVGCPGMGGVPCTYKVGTKSPGVCFIQRYLGLPVDGKYGKTTAQAVKEWQSKHGLKADGVFGATTNKAMGGLLPW